MYCKTCYKVQNFLVDNCMSASRKKKQLYNTVYCTHLKHVWTMLIDFLCAQAGKPSVPAHFREINITLSEFEIASARTLQFRMPRPNLKETRGRSPWLCAKNEGGVPNTLWLCVGHHFRMVCHLPKLENHTKPSNFNQYLGDKKGG